ncbi:MAG: metallophosphoesterase family protein [Betaproteobacteria bacterium]|nr:metallophosphoesterase family protein [Betaproteobacteria bacterium]
MKIQLASDLHLEFLARQFPNETLIAPAVGADVLVLAGDIGNDLLGVNLFAHWPVPVIYVPGNHEYYGTDWPKIREQLQRAARGTSVTVLDNGTWEYKGVRFLGATLWTDYRLRANRTQRQLMDVAGSRLRDHSVIRAGAEAFTPAMALSDHEQSRRWLEEQLALPFAGRTVVVTHHAPSARSIHPRFLGEPVNAAFVSELDGLVEKADLWLHGHVHDSFDYAVGGCRVVANPRGYPMNRRSVDNVRQLEFENPAFQWACLLDV